MTIFFSILIAILLIGIIFINFSILSINVKELEIVNTKIKKFKLTISLNLFENMTWLKLTLDNNKIMKLKNKGKIEVFNKILKTNILKNYKNVKTIQTLKKIIKVLKIFNIENLKVNIIISTKEADKTAYIVATTGMLLPIIFGRKADRLHYKIDPMYLNKNYLFMSLNCIFSVKLVHIINTRKLFTKKDNNRKEVYQ